MEFLSKEATGFECNITSLSSPATEWQTVNQFSNYSPASFRALIIPLLYSTATVPVPPPWSIRWIWKQIYAHAAEQRYSSLQERLQTWMLSQTTRTAKSQGTSFTYGWWLPRCHTAQSKADRRWYCAHNMWGLSMCRPHCIYGEKCLVLVRN